MEPKLSAAWDSMKEETIEAMMFLGLENEEISGPISLPVESAGDGNNSGGTRGFLVTSREFGTS